MTAATEFSADVGVKPACEALGVPRATWYRRQNPLSEEPQQPRPKPPRTLSEQERKDVLDVLCLPRFVDRSPDQVVATLLDEGIWMCSVRTMYRILAEHAPVRERRNQLRHPKYKKPELLATGPNQVWSWDITKLKGPAKWTHFYLLVIIDIFSRYVVGWMVADKANTALAKRLISETCTKQGVREGELTIHSDRGGQMISKGTAQLLADLGVTRSLNRPHVSNDNPFSEAHFKTVKYHPEFPACFGSGEDALSYFRHFFQWYNTEHRHSGIAMLTPESVHYGDAKGIIEKRRTVLEAAYVVHPERFVKGMPKTRQLPTAVWINPPEPPCAAEGGVQ